ncbi:MAG TPA: dTMP kinase [Verrucomicrobiae bacterium]|nr:dTMP kinase [Verrucomicrobiae bacterium]
MTTGRFITLEGSEGCGKSTQAAILARRLRDAGHPVIETREPGGTPLGEEIRHLLKFHAASRGMCPEAELLLFSASRAQLVRDVIRPALAAGTLIICDRFLDSSTMYQGIARGLPHQLVQHVHTLAVGDTLPNLTLVLDMDPEKARLRAMRRPRPAGGPEDRMEAEPAEFYRNVAEGYRALAAAEPRRVRIVSAEGPPDEVAARIWEEVRHVL